MEGAEALPAHRAAAQGLGRSPDPNQTAQRIADQLGPLVRLARAKGFDFLAYLLGMALKELRRLSQE